MGEPTARGGRRRAVVTGRISRRRILLALAPVLLVPAGVPLGLIVLEALSGEPRPADLIVVLGNKVEPSGQPGARLAARLDRALACFRAGLAPAVFVSGGTGVEGHDEAKAMGDWLAARGVPRSAIIEDPGGWDTALTAQHTAKYLATRNLSRALVVSQWFHLYRCRVALSTFGVTDVSTAAPRYGEWRDPYSVLREIPGIWDYWLR